MGERISKTAYEICNDPARHRIKLNEQHTGFILESNDTAVLGWLGWTIKQHLDTIATAMNIIMCLLMLQLFNI